MKHPLRFVVISAFVMVFVCGCKGFSRTTNPPTQAAIPSTTISIIIPIQPEKFSKQAVVKVDLLNAEQIAIEDANPICVITGNGSGVTYTQCPPGTEYKEVTPKEFTFPIGEVGNQIQIASTQVKLGEQFRITLTGLSQDDCNARSTRYTGVANENEITLTDLLWATTLMACVKAP